MHNSTNPISQPLAMNFAAIKKEVLALAEAKRACNDQHVLALEATDIQALGQVLKNNFFWCVEHELLTADTITRWNLSAVGITSNEDVLAGCYGIASGSATVEAYDSATVRAYDSATVRAYDSATVRASGSATVEAYGSAYVLSYSAIECKLSDRAIVRVGSTVHSLAGDIKFP